ncbi:WAS/WASL-interacting protein family member 1-like [Penaeus monodon]|uniref:WAS/WASL-interacting protein family member 1-like n=1 Tax=Penaeus monodon TaxID=6687 RepID=UPI0018A7BDAF|nr:WAS/WASL-interacting protein family member 1-like [Penaeus monodon]
MLSPIANDGLSCWPPRPHPDRERALSTLRSPLTEQEHQLNPAETGSPQRTPKAKRATETSSQPTRWSWGPRMSKGRFPPASPGAIKGTPKPTLIWHLRLGRKKQKVPDLLKEELPPTRNRRSPKKWVSPQVKHERGNHGKKGSPTAPHGPPQIQKVNPPPHLNPGYPLTGRAYQADSCHNRIRKAAPAQSSQKGSPPPSGARDSRRRRDPSTVSLTMGFNSDLNRSTMPSDGTGCGWPSLANVLETSPRSLSSTPGPNPSRGGS